MDFKQFFTQLEQKNIEIGVVDGKLRVVDPNKNIDAQLLSVLKSERDNIIDYIENTLNNNVMPLSFAQQRMWFIDQLSEGSAHFNMPGHFPLQGQFNLPAFKLALSTILSRHDILVTRYIITAGEVEQVIEKDYPLPLIEEDFSSLSEEQKSHQVKHLMALEANTPFDLSKDLMLRCRLIKFSDTEHLVLYTMHHIACDGVSMGIFIGELQALYQAFAQNRGNPLPPPTIQYRDYAKWQRDWLTGDVLTKHLAYWQTQLAGVSGLHNLPLDRPRPAQQVFDGNTYQQWLCPALTEDIHAFCTQQNVSMFMFIQTAFALFIGRYSHDEDIVMGTPVSGRDHQDVENLIGFFVNSLVLRTDLSGQPSFIELLARNRKMILDAYNHQYLPFEMLVEQLKLQADMSHDPVFQIRINDISQVMSQVQSPANKAAQKQQQSTTQTTTQTTSASAKDGFSSAANARSELTLYFAADSNQIQLSWNFRTNLFDDDTIVQMSRCFNHLLQDIIKSPDESVNQLQLMSEQTQQQLKQQLCQQPPASYHPSLIEPVHQQIAKLAVSDPDKIAIHCHQNTISYGQLNTQVDGVGQFLLTYHWTNSKARIGILLPRQIELVVSILAVLKSGGCYVPLAPELPDERLAYMIADSQLDYVICDDSTRNRLDALLCNDEQDKCQIILINEALATSCEPDFQWPSVKCDDDCHIIYTSGSSGQPKGVKTCHKTLNSRVSWFSRQFPYQQDEVACHITSIGFIRAVWELFVPLSQGVKLILIDTEQVKDNYQLAQAIAKYGITRIVTAPSLANELVRLTINEPKVLSSLRYWFISGEPLYYQLAQKVHHAIKGLVLCNIYGSTETNTPVCYHVVEQSTCDDRNDLQSKQRVPIGRATDGNSIVIVDDAGQLMPVGVAGEICVSGTNIASSYINVKPVDEKRFVFDDNNGTWLYRTGDLGRLLPDYSIDYLSRRDNQIKIRGFRIELGEIHNQIARSGLAQSNVLITKTDKTGQLFIVAYLVKSQHLIEQLQGITEKNLQKQQATELINQSISKVLPDYMLPKVYVFVEQLPLMPNGKVNKHALPELGQDDFLLQAYEPPRNKLQKNLCELFESVLELEQVGINDNFFSLGGHSLLSARLVSLIREQLGCNLVVRQLFECPTVARLSHLIESSGDTEVDDPIVPIAAADDFPVSYAQKVAWLHNRIGLLNGWDSFFIQKNIYIERPNIELLVEALNQLFDRHEIFKATVQVVDGQLRQVFCDLKPLTVEAVLIDLSEHPDPQAQLSKIQVQQKNHTVDMAELPFFSVKLVKVNHVVCLILTIDHVCVDAQSMTVLEREFEQLYLHLKGDSSELLPALEVDYKEYASWEYQQIEGDDSQMHRQYWHQMLQHDMSGFNPLRFFSDRHNHSNRSYKQTLQQQMDNTWSQVDPIFAANAFGSLRQLTSEQSKVARYTCCVDEQTYSGLKAISNRAQVMFSVVVIASINVLLHQLTGKQKNVMSLLTDARIYQSLADMVGCFAHDVLFMAHVEQQWTIEQLCSYVQRQIKASTEHKVYPMTRVTSELDLSLEMIQTIQLNLINIMDKPMALFEAKHDNHGIADMGIHLDIMTYQNTMVVDCQYCCKLFDAQTIESIMQFYLKLLNQLVIKRDGTISQLDKMARYPRTDIQ